MAERSRISGLYLITDDRLSGKGELMEIVQIALENGVSILQYRDKHSEPIARYKIAMRLREMTRAYGVPLVINDFVFLAAEVGADGVHLGLEEARLPLARKILGSEAIIGVSCHNRVDDAVRMEAEGADYVAFGAIYRSPTKPRASRASIETIREARSRLGIPIVAIGGITPENAEPVLQAGADALAVISAVFSAPYPGKVIARFQNVLQKYQKTSPSGAPATSAPSDRPR